MQFKLNNLAVKGVSLTEQSNASSYMDSARRNNGITMTNQSELDA